MNERIKKVIDYLNISQAEFAKEINTQRANISHILAGRNNPSIDFLQKLLKRYPEINAEWLLLGHGNMTKVTNNLQEKSDKKQQDLFTNINEKEKVNNNTNVNESNSVNKISDTNRKLVDDLQISNNEFTNQDTKFNINNQNKQTNQYAYNSSQNINQNQSFNNNNQQSAPFVNQNQQNVIISADGTPDNIIILFNDNTFSTYKKRN